MRRRECSQSLIKIKPLCSGSIIRLFIVIIKTDETNDVEIKNMFKFHTGVKMLEMARSRATLEKLNKLYRQQPLGSQ